MAECVRCFDFYSDKRKAIGYNTCLECGGTAAAKEVVRRSQCSAPGYNKGQLCIHSQPLSSKGRRTMNYNDDTRFSTDGTGQSQSQTRPNQATL